MNRPGRSGKAIFTDTSLRIEYDDGEVVEYAELVPLSVRLAQTRFMVGPGDTVTWKFCGSLRDWAAEEASVVNQPKMGI